MHRYEEKVGISTGDSYAELLRLWVGELKSLVFRIENTHATNDLLWKVEAAIDYVPTWREIKSEATLVAGAEEYYEPPENLCRYVFYRISVKSAVAGNAATVDAAISAMP